jgi:ribosomal protein S6
MPLYKQVLITNLKSTPGDVAKVFQECAQIITSHGGVIRALENRGEKRLGYAIEDRRWGELQRHYEGKLVVTQFNTSPTTLKEVETKLKNSFPVIRFQTFKVRDPIDSLMNTKQPLAAIQSALTPLTKDARLKAIQEKKKADAEKQEALDKQFFRPEIALDKSDDDEVERFKQYVPEWKRDASFTPSVPEHLKD